jgi:hypothetical protein
MKIFNKIKDIIYKNKKNNIVLIKSKFGLPSVRVCGVVLADVGTPCNPDVPCGVRDAADPCPTLGVDPGCPGLFPPCPAVITDPCVGGDGTPTVYMPTPVTGYFGESSRLGEHNTNVLEEKFQNKTIYFRENNLEFKNLISSLEGIIFVIFGKAIVKDSDEDIDCICVRFNPNLSSPIALIKIYHFMSIKQKEIFVENDEEKKHYEELLNNYDINIPIFKIKHFES